MHRLLPRFAGALALMVLGPACPDDAPSRSLDAATSGMDAASASEVAVGGTPDGSVAACEAPCVHDLVAACTLPEGACMAELDQAAGEVRVCYANGAKYVRRTTAAKGTDLFINADGMTCYSLETSLVPGQTSQIQRTWRNGRGVVIATGIEDRSKQESTVTCADGARYVAGASCMKPKGASEGCSEGTCR